MVNELFCNRYNLPQFIPNGPPISEILSISQSKQTNHQGHSFWDTHANIQYLCIIEEMTGIHYVVHQF